MKEISLTNQLIFICILIVGIICIALGIILLVVYYDVQEGSNREHDLLSLGSFIEHIIL